jgi:hypothetical protein
MPNRTVPVRAFLICLLALAVLAFRAPSSDLSALQNGAVADHDHHGHSHDDDQPVSSPVGHDHDRFHVGDHSHETPNSANVLTFALHALKDPGLRAPDERVASTPPPPNDRPPWSA